jgi:hypothetical protein
VVNTSPKPQAGGPALVGCPQLFIQYIRSCPPNWRLFFHPQPEDVPCLGDRDPLIMEKLITKLKENTWGNLQIKNHNNSPELSLSDYRHDTKVHTHVFNFLTLLTPSVQKVVIQNVYKCSI